MQLDAIKTHLAALVDLFMRRVDYYALYPAVVVSQNGDKTLELRPESEKLPQGMSTVPIRLGIPGATVTVEAGARVLVGFENGDPKRPYAGLWDTASVVEISINGGSTPVAKEGSSITGTAGPFPIVANVSIGAGAPSVKVP